MGFESENSEAPLKIVDTLPRQVREIQTCWIPLADGCRLAARIWLPVDAEDDPVPAILEYLPYRRRDGTVLRDAETYRYLAGHGYAGVRVDLRGAGDSDGLMRDEYLAQEQADACEVIAWLADQPWCTGAVGMWGISWGGFNALQVAACRPPALKAIITLCSTDDRYADDTHYMGGCLLSGSLSWAATMFAFSARPPDPAVVGDGWRAQWLERLENIPRFAALWTAHQRRDAYWRHGSVCEDFADIACPVYAVGGWADAYSNAIPRLLAGLTVPRKGLIGPWAHAYPHVAKPGPAIGFLQEARRWWDHWLKGAATGIMDEPMLRVWMQESVPPAPHYETWPGRWIAEPTWPSPDIATRTFRLGDGEAVSLCSPQDTGATAGAWCPYGLPGDMPVDQAADDARSLTFDLPALGERLEVLGAPVVMLDLAADKPAGFVAVRLVDVAPDGAATRIGYGLLNLTHRDSDVAPMPLQPGQRYRVRIQLSDIGHAFPAGHRLRVAVSTAYWPTVWPSPEVVTLQLFPAGCGLDLPVRAPRAEDRTLPPFPSPEAAATVPHTLRREGQRERFVERDGSVIRVTAHKDRGAVHLHDIDLEIDGAGVESYEIDAADPLSAQLTAAWTYRLSRGAWRVRTQTRYTLTATVDTFSIDASLAAYEGDACIFTRTWRDEIPRDHV